MLSSVMSYSDSKRIDIYEEGYLFGKKLIYITENKRAKTQAMTVQKPKSARPF